MPERKGAAYRITTSRPAHHHGEHTQTTQATAWANQVGEQSGRVNPTFPGSAIPAGGRKDPRFYGKDGYPINWPRD